MSIQTKAFTFIYSCLIALVPIYAETNSIVVEESGVAINHIDGDPIEADFQVDGSTKLNGILSLKPMATIPDASGNLGDLYLNFDGKLYLHDGAAFNAIGSGGHDGNNPPVARAGADQTVQDIDFDGSELVSLDGSASSDSDSTIVSYSWSSNGSVIATEASPSVTLNVGVHNITLTVTDDCGATHSDDVTVTVEVLDTDNISFWRLDETDGTLASDSSDNNNNGILNGSMTFSGNGMVGKVGRALVFDGSDDYIDVGDAADLRNLVDTTDFSIFTWMKMTKHNSTSGSGGWRQRIAHKRNSDGWIFLVGDNRELSFVTVSSGSGDASYSSHANAVPLNEWILVGFVYSKDTQSCKLYINGEETAYTNQRAGVGVTHADAGGEFEIGRSFSGGPDQFFNGLIDECRVYSKALSDQEILNMYQSEI